MILSQTLAPTALRNGTRIAFRYLGKGITYREFWETCNRYSYYFGKELGYGLRVGLWMSNCPHVAYSFIALSNTKNCTVPLNPWALPAENLFKIKNADLSVILCSSDHTKQVTEFLRENGLSSIKVVDMESKRAAEYDPSYSPPAAHVPNDKDDVLLFYTAGTNGKYKGCLFNHPALNQALTAAKMGHKASMADTFHTQHHYSDPFNFIHFLLMPLSVGATVFISDQNDMKAMLGDLVEYRVTRMAPKPAMIDPLVRFSETEKMPIVTVKHFVLYNAAPLPKETWDVLKRATKVGIMNVYGLTEYLGTVAMGNPEFLADPAKPGLLGPAVFGAKVRVVDDNNDEIDKKKPQKGQLLVMGPSLMTRYLDLPEDQKMTVRGTWLFTGDVVDIDKDGNLTFVDRKDDIVSLGDGKKIFAQDVEPVIYQIPQVEHAAFVGIRDRMKKPVAAIVIVRKPQAALTEKQVQEFVAGKLTADKRPQMILFVDAMPRTVTGAINRAKLRSQFDGV